MRSPIVLVFGLCLTPAFAQALTGQEIAKKSDAENNKGYKGQRAIATMTLYGPDGKATIRYQMLQLAKEGKGSTGPKTLIRFTAPADTKGTALLTHEAIKGEDKRWLYLRETRQLKRISGSNKSASFKGSELSYEDLTTTVVPRYVWKLLGEKKIGGVPCYEVERRAKFEGSGYKRSIVYYHKQNFYPVEIRYFDRAGQPLKVAKFEEYKKYDGKWRAHSLVVANIQTKRRTTLKTDKWALGQSLPESSFTTSQLTR